MSGINNWVRNFKARCEDVGWRVDMSGSSHYKVYDRSDKLILTFAGSPGDRRAMLNALSSAKRAGLEDLEKSIKLRRERDRLQRIENDRAANEVKLTEVSVKLAGIREKFDAQGDDEVDSDVPGKLGFIDGVAIAAIAPAMIKTPVMKQAAPLNGGSEVMLTDGTVLWRCDRPAATGTKMDIEGDCHRTFASVTSLRVHMGSHTRAADKNVVAAVDQSVARETNPMSTEPKMSPNGVSPNAQLTARLNSALETVDLMARSLTAVKTELTAIQSDLSKLQVTDDDTLAKAAKFDTLSGNLRALLS
jgi:hypothetical protein